MSGNIFNRSIPLDVVMPELAYPDVVEAVDWLCRVYGFTRRIIISDHRAQLHVGVAGAVIVSHLQVENPLLIECALSHSVLVRIENVDKHYQRALINGATILSSPTDQPYGERQYRTQDLGGHVWTFTQSIFDADPNSWGGTTFEL